MLFEKHWYRYNFDQYLWCIVAPHFFLACVIFLYTVMVKLGLQNYGFNRGKFGLGLGHWMKK